MCGIATISPAPGSDLPVRALSRWLLIDLASRGRDAAGIAWHRSDDGSTLYRKVSGHPAKLASHLSAVSGTRSLDKSRAVILHTRYSTHGSPKVQANNHPVIRDGVALVHNGVLTNAAALHRLAKTTDTAAEVDSDALAALVSTAPTQKALLRRLTRVQGSAACAWLNVTDDPSGAGSLWVARIDTRPFVLGWTPAGDCIGASTEHTLRKACHTAGVKLREVLHLPEGTVMNIVDGDVVEWLDIPTGSGKAESVVEYSLPTGNYRAPHGKDDDMWTLDDALACSGD